MMLNNVQLSCDIPTIYSTAHEERCRLVESLCSEENMLINFIPLHFCTFKESAALSVSLSLTTIILLFTLIGDICDHYLVAGMLKLLLILEIDQSKAGKTLIPIINASGDMITIIMASNGGESLDLALGALFGANMIACGLVLPSIILISAKNAYLDVVPSRLYIEIMFFLFGCVCMGVGSKYSIGYWMLSVILLLLFIVYISVVACLPAVSDNDSIYKPSEPKEAVSELIEKQNIQRGEEHKMEGVGLLQVDAKETQAEEEKRGCELVLKKIEERIQHSWADHNVFFKISYLLTLPLRVLIEVTIPPIEFEMYHEYQKYIYPITTLIFSAFSFSIHNSRVDFYFFDLKLWIVAIFIGFCMTLYLILKHKDKSLIPTPTMIFILLTLLGSVAWISLLVKVILNAVELLRLLTGFSQLLFGTLLVAFGSSYPDLIVNTALARKGFYLVAISNAFAAQLINLLLGFGISCFALFLNSPIDDQTFELFDNTMKDKKGNNMMTIAFGGSFLTQLYLLFKIVLVNRSKLYIHDAFINMIIYGILVLLLLITETY